jgi:hypothetical protein
MKLSCVETRTKKIICVERRDRIPDYAGIPALTPAPSRTQATTFPAWLSLARR